MWLTQLLLMDTANIDTVFNDMANYFANQMKINLGAKVKRKTYRASWSNGKPKNVSVKSIRANHIASGSLLKSIKVVPGITGGYSVQMNKYGKFINDGRLKGKGIPVNQINKWVSQKKIKPRNLESGQFIKNTKNNRNGIAFCMNRKIKYFGIEAYPFIKTSKDSTIIKYNQIIPNLAKKDLIKALGVILKPKK